MADRITVVISQSAHGNSQLRAFEDKLIAELLFQQTIDLTVVPDLTQLAADSTGLLCLEGIRGPMVMIADASAEETHDRLAEHAIAGKLGRLEGSAIEVNRGVPPEPALAPGVYDAMQRTIYCLDMTAFTTAEDVCNTVALVQQHLADSRIRGRSDLPLVTAPGESDSSRATDGDGQEGAPAVRPVPRRSQFEPQEDPAIDDLLDELDDMEL